jgi:hypothetical protein
MAGVAWSLLNAIVSGSVPVPVEVICPTMTDGPPPTGV